MKILQTPTPHSKTIIPPKHNLLQNCFIHKTEKNGKK